MRCAFAISFMRGKSAGASRRRYVRPGMLETGRPAAPIAEVDAWVTESPAGTACCGVTERTTRVTRGQGPPEGHGGDGSRAGRRRHRVEGDRVGDALGRDLRVGAGGDVRRTPCLAAPGVEGAALFG